MTPAPDPFAALGLPARPDLTDEQVRQAWRKTAAATHPDRKDGGDTARYTAAVAAYAQLRTRWGRSEAYADLAAARAVTDPAAPPDDDEHQGAAAVRPGTRAAALVSSARLLPARIRHGRPLRVAARAVTAAVACLLVLHIIGGHPAAPALVAGITLWWLLTARADLAPLPGR
ncbi:MAG TPA: J domain-containing protein [Streptosporangiaceae bacterium]|nr:J domain-containing protein [Streptosporangiaceae bacterium]